MNLLRYLKEQKERKARASGEAEQDDAPQSGGGRFTRHVALEPVRDLPVRLTRAGTAITGVEYDSGEAILSFTMEGDVLALKDVVYGACSDLFGHPPYFSLDAGVLHNIQKEIVRLGAAERMNGGADNPLHLQFRGVIMDVNRLIIVNLGQDEAGLLMQVLQRAVPHCFTHAALEEARQAGLTEQGGPERL